MKKIKWVNKGRTFGVLLTLVSLIAINTTTVQSLIVKAFDYMCEGSTIYCYQNDISDAWWQTR